MLQLRPDTAKEILLKKKKELKEQNLDVEILYLDTVKKHSFIFARKILKLFHKLESTLLIIYITNTHEH